MDERDSKTNMMLRRNFLFMQKVRDDIRSLNFTKEPVIPEYVKRPDHSGCPFCVCPIDPAIMAHPGQMCAFHLILQKSSKSFSKSRPVPQSSPVVAQEGDDLGKSRNQTDSLSLSEIKIDTLDDTLDDQDDSVLPDKPVPICECRELILPECSPDCLYCRKAAKSKLVEESDQLQD